ncbi:MAG: chemotaxis protein CheW [Promethearchaeota archaeon]
MSYNDFGNEDLFAFLGFVIQNEYYCIDLQNVHEIIYIPQITKIPNVPIFIDGIINLRGKVIHIINLRKWMGFTDVKISNESRIIILGSNNSRFGILVDQIYDIFRISKEKKHEKHYLIAQQTEGDYIQNFILHKDEIFIEINSNKLQ